MPNTIEADPVNLDAPRSPVSISTESIRRGSLKTIHQAKDSEPSAPVSPPFRLTRKRAASLNTESTNLPPRIEDLVLNSASTSGPPTSDLSREQVCLCQPDPKIPRPRNAFILYRQHYQAQVVAQHPGLANPEISKIIGEQWREQPQEVKSDWKRLAEEEKQRHQRQYPGYRYQPRRAGKPNGVRPATASSADDPLRCPKCNGRYISTPSTPSTPFTPAFGAVPRNEHHIPPFTPISVSHTAPLERPQILSQMQNRMDTPRTAHPHQQNQRRSPHHHSQPLHTHHELNEDMDLLSPSPDQKRRRFNPEPQLQRNYASSSPVSFSAPQSFSRNGAPMSATGYRQQQFPGPGMLARPGVMGPPPQQSPMIQSRQHYPSRPNHFDESLRLPPLQTQVSNSTSTATQRPDLRAEDRDSQARSVEAMVMTIPYVNKIKVLYKISPPLAQSGPTSPAQRIRGAVVAVEGADKALLTEIGAFLNDYLSKDTSCAVRNWSASKADEQKASTQTTDTEMTDGESSSSKTLVADLHPAQDPFVEYLSLISEWHKKSQEITEFITNPPSNSSVDTEPSSIAGAPSLTSKIIPIALLPLGFSLTASDDFASRIPINDSYAPVDHWQWMATLWRGIVGPDLTIYAKRVDKDEMERFGGVEVRGDCKGIVVRVLETEKMDEKTARRLGFEVIEWVRLVEGGFGKS